MLPCGNDSLPGGYHLNTSVYLNFVTNHFYTLILWSSIKLMRTPEDHMLFGSLMFTVVCCHILSESSPLSGSYPILHFSSNFASKIIFFSELALLIYCHKHAASI